MTTMLEGASRVVIKTGSALIANRDGTPRRDWLNGLAQDIAGLKHGGCQIVLVTSGAIALGRNALPQDKPQDLAAKQAAAALGQPRLMAALADAFAVQDITIAQSLLTLEDTERRRRWLNARATMETLLEAGALPVINENDTVATDEIRYGDNDRLAARVAQMISADVLVLLSDIDGLYTADPRHDPTAQHIPGIRELTPEIMAMGGTANADAGVGSGGMATKLAAAEIAFAAGCATAITQGDVDRPLTALASGARASWFLPQTTPDTARRTWLRGHLTPEGRLRLDRGAVAALRDGASLLAVGVTEVGGQFERGAALALIGPNGAQVGKGVTAYSSSDIRRVLGLKGVEVEAALGYRGRPAIIHRDDMVLE